MERNPKLSLREQKKNLKAAENVLTSQPEWRGIKKSLWGFNFIPLLLTLPPKKEFFAADVNFINKIFSYLNLNMTSYYFGPG